MWPSKKKEKKGIKLAPGESMEIGFATSWRRDKDEVVIMTDNGPIVLDGKSKLFIEISAENIDPIKVQMIPDFKNKTINLVEVLDPNAKKKFPYKDGPRLTLAGSIIKERGISLGDYLKHWDKDMEQFEKSTKRSKLIRDVFVPVNIILCIWNFYNFMTKTDMMRYFNLFAAILSGFMIFYVWNSHKKFHHDYKQYKELRDRAFEVVKNK